MGIQINGQIDRISAVDGSFSIQDLAEVNVTGVATASNFKSGTSNVHSTGYECTNINATGIVTAASANFTGNVSIGGTLTYQDVTNIDSVGIVTARAGVKVPDNQKVFLGTGDDLQIYHDGSNARIKNTTGQLWLQSDNGIRFVDSDVNESTARFTDNGAVELYYDGTKKFETTSAGIKVSGSFPDITIHDTDTTNDNFRILHNGGGTQLLVDPNNVGPNASHFIVGIDGTERLRIDSSGRLLLACTTPPNSGVNAGLQIQHTSTANITLARNDSSITDGNALGRIDFYGNDGGTFEHCATIAAQADGAHAHGDKPMRLIFGTSADGAATPTERLRIDSAGTIKCGTSSTLKAEINSAIGGHQFISQCSDNNNGFEIYQQHGSTTTRNTFAVYANTGAGGSQELQFSVRGDGSVTKPKNPAFAARRIGDINIATSGNTDVVFNDELIDNGNNYNPSNGRFTASIAGTYYFGVNLYVGFSVTAVRVMHSTFNKNGSTYAAVDLFGGVSNAAGTHYHPTGSSGMLIDLNVNDYVTFNLGSLSVTGSGNTFLYGTNGTRFFGYLVG